MKSRAGLAARFDHATVVNLELDETFQPCPAEPGDELYPNGIFEFNITRLLALVETHIARFPIERVAVEDIPADARTSIKELSARQTCSGRSSWWRFRLGYST